MCLNLNQIYCRISHQNATTNSLDRILTPLPCYCSSPSAIPEHALLLNTLSSQRKPNMLPHAPHHPLHVVPPSTSVLILLINNPKLSKILRKFTRIILSHRQLTHPLRIHLTLLEEALPLQPLPIRFIPLLTPVLL